MKRFREKFATGSGCWNWLAYRTSKGYGQFYFQGRPQKAHRVSWVLHCGTIPDGMCVLHRCDNPSCVRPSHLFLGTHGDNSADKVAKCRQSRHQDQRGEKNYNAKLTEEQIADIRESYRPGMGNVLADHYGISGTHLRRIVNGARW